MRCVSLVSIWLLSISLPSSAQPETKIIRMHAIKDFPILTRDGMASNRKDYGPYHIEEDLNALAGDDLNFTFHMAAAEGIFPGVSGTYTICLNTLTERDGECVYNVYVNDEPVGLFQKNPPTNEFTAPATLKWKDIEIPANAKIRVESNNWSNLLRHELNFFEYARGRWTSTDFIPSEGSIPSSVPNRLTGIFRKVEAVGSDALNAKATYNEVEDAYYLMTSGTGGKGFGYLWKKVNGDFALETMITKINLNDHPGGEQGLMIRQSSETDASYIACGSDEEGKIFLNYVSDSRPRQIQFSVVDAEMLMIERKGAVFTISAAKFGMEYERHSIELEDVNISMLVGFYINSNESYCQEIARFSRVRLFEDIKAE